MTTTISGTTGIDKVQDGTIVQADLAPNVAGNGPAFTAAINEIGTVNGTLLLQPIEELDTHNAYSAGVFTPLVAGYYQYSATFQVSATTVSYVAIQLKRGAGVMAINIGGPYVTSYGAATLSALVYMNGTTDNLSLTQDISVTGAPTISHLRVGCFLARAA